MISPEYAWMIMILARFRNHKLLSKWIILFKSDEYGYSTLKISPDLISKPNSNKKSSGYEIPTETEVLDARNRPSNSSSLQSQLQNLQSLEENLLNLERLHDEGLLSCSGSESEDESEVECDSEVDSDEDEEVSEGEPEVETEGESEFGSESVHDYFSYSTSYPETSHLRPIRTLPLMKNSSNEEIEVEADEAEVTR